MLQSGGLHLLKFLRHTISEFVFIPMNAGQLETAISFNLKTSCAPRPGRRRSSPGLGSAGSPRKEACLSGIPDSSHILLIGQVWENKGDVAVYTL